MKNLFHIKCAIQKQKVAGFTLIEVIAVLALLGILAVSAAKYYTDLSAAARSRAMEAAVAELNGREKLAWGKAMLESGGSPIDSAVFGVVVADDLGSDYSWQIGPQQVGLSELLFQGHSALLARAAANATSPGNWRMESAGSLYTIAVADGLQLGSHGWSSQFLVGAYTGTLKDIFVPNSIDGTVLERIWQDVFNASGLTSVTFANDSEIDYIHARAFLNNGLTEVVLPPLLTRIDTKAFDGNAITSVTLPDTVTTIETNAFTGLESITVGGNLNFTTHPQGNTPMLENAINGSNAFRDAYLSAGGGAGTYEWDGVNWVKTGG